MSNATTSTTATVSTSTSNNATSTESKLPPNVHAAVVTACTALDNFKANSALKRVLRRREERAAKRVKATADPFVGGWSIDDVLNLVCVPVDPIPAHLITHHAFCKDRENRPFWYKTFGDSQWALLMTKATQSTKAAWDKWEEFMHVKMPWDYHNHNFAKTAIIAIMHLLPPLPVKDDLSTWRDPEYGDAAMRIEKLLVFDSPVYVCQLPQGYCTRLNRLKNSAAQAKHVHNRLRNGDYKWHWKCLENNHPKRLPI
jgi:hypothetical protein